MLHCLAGVLAGVLAVNAMGATTVAGNTERIENMNAGAATILETDVIAELKEKTDSENVVEMAEAVSRTMAEKDVPAEEDKEQSGPVMAKVSNSLNVRAEADEASEKVGLLYADCGGEILKRENGWTKLQSGDLVGWAKDEYLVFGEDAEKLAEEVGNLIMTIDADALRIRKEPGEDAGIYGVYTQDDIIEPIEDLGGWISVAYNNEIGYVSSDYVSTEFKIDSGETMEVILAREKAEAERKAKLRKNQGAVAVEAADDVLLAALIYCEAGNQPYEGQLAVGAVVMNRVRSGAYPNTVPGVIYASGQFTPALNGKVARTVERGVPASCLQAAQEAIAGATTVGGATHFRRAGYRDGIVIGAHVFW